MSSPQDKIWDRQECDRIDVIEERHERKALAIHNLTEALREFFSVSESEKVDEDDQTLKVEELCKVAGRDWEIRMREEV